MMFTNNQINNLPFRISRDYNNTPISQTEFHDEHEVQGLLDDTQNIKSTKFLLFLNQYYRVTALPYITKFLLLL